MELCNIEIASGSSEDAVQFIRHLDENLDPSGEYDCQVWLETVNANTVESIPGEDITTRGPESEKEDWGVHIYIEFDENSDCPDNKFAHLARNFFGDDYVLNAGFNGGSGEYNGYVFPTKVF